jgi:hypothetical protein
VNATVDAGGAHLHLLAQGADALAEGRRVQRRQVLIKVQPRLQLCLPSMFELSV